MERLVSFSDSQMSMNKTMDCILWLNLHSVYRTEILHTGKGEQNREENAVYHNMHGL